MQNSLAFRREDGRTRPVALALAVALIAMTWGSTSLRAQQASFSDFPLVIYCEFKGIQHAYYFSQLGPDGQAIYLTPDRQIGAITIDGPAERLGGERAGSCLDKTLADLRSAGQVVELPR